MKLETVAITMEIALGLDNFDAYLDAYNVWLDAYEAELKSLVELLDSPLDATTEPQTAPQTQPIPPIFPKLPTVSVAKFFANLRPVQSRLVKCHLFRPARRERQMA